VKLFVEEAGTDAVQEATAAAQVVVTSHLTYVEAHAAFGRMHADGRLSDAAHDRTIGAFRSFWADVASVDVVREVIGRAASLATAHRLRAYDAVHLASALAVAAAGELEFSCWDGELRAAARNEALTLHPRSL
jgi:predicted nucleic acid-binding protein